MLISFTKSLWITENSVEEVLKPLFMFFDINIISNLDFKKDIKFTGLMNIYVSPEFSLCWLEQKYSIAIMGKIGTSGWKSVIRKKHEGEWVRKPRLCIWCRIIVKGTVNYKVKETNYTFSYSVNNSFCYSQGQVRFFFVSLTSWCFLLVLHKIYVKHNRHFLTK